MFNKNLKFLSARVVLVFMMIVGILGVMPEQVSAEAIDGSISGTVYRSDDATPIANIFVFVEGNSYSASTCTNASGQFAFSGVPFGVQLIVDASPPWAKENCGQWSNYVREFWQEALNHNNASSITLDVQNPDVGIDFTLDAGGVITGTTYASDGVTLLPHIAISFESVDRSYTESICTDENGQYEFHGVPFDIPLRVRANSYLDDWCNAGANYIREYWGETLNDGPTLLTVTAASSPLTGIDFAMDLDDGSLPNPFLRTWPKGGVVAANSWPEGGDVEANGWPDGTHLKLKIEDTSTLQSPDYSAEMDVTANDGGRTFFRIDGQFEIKPDMLVSVSGDYLTRIMYVDPVTITNVDPVLDTITGTTGPNLWMWMFIYSSSSPDGQTRSTVANGSGNWMMDFSVPGAEGQPVADIGPGWTGAIHVPSGYDGSTSVLWFVPSTLNVNSVAANDGWVLESGENSNIGGTLNTKATTFDLGDDKANKQYLGVLHFDTSGLPDTAVITSVTLKVLKQGKIGTDPFTTHGDLVVDIQQPYFGTTDGLVVGDFQATSGQSAVATFGLPPVSNWYSAIMNGAGYAYINLTGTTQFRLRFTLDDNNDRGADYLKFYSGDASVANRPQLIIQYYIP